MSPGDQTTGEWRKLYKKEINELYPSLNIIRVIQAKRMRYAKRLARMGDRKVAPKVMVGKHEGKRPRGRQRRRWEDNIKIDLQELGSRDMDWIDLA